MSDIVVVIPCWNEEKNLPRQLSALDAQTDLDFSVIISDNGSTDGTRRLAEAWVPKFSGLRVIDSSFTQGAAHARNAAIRASDEPLILICDGDDRVHPQWVAAMRSGLEEHVCVTGPLHLVYPDSPEQRSEVWNRDSVPVSMGHRPYMPGGNIGMRREVFEATEGFDETLATGQEDVDFGWRLHDHGFAIAHVPEASIDYFQRSGFRNYLRQQWKYGKAHVALYARHREEGIPTASKKASLRWFIEWSKQLPGRIKERELRAALGPFVFQLSRNRESCRRGIQSPL